MIIKNEKKALEKLVFINYYKLKEALFPFFFENKYIENIRFEDIVFRFYEDRNLRLYKKLNTTNIKNISKGNIIWDITIIVKSIQPVFQSFL